MRTGTPRANASSMPATAGRLEITAATRTGKVLGPEHCVSPWTALQALTIWPAYQHFEEDTKGSIEPGKLADLVILSDNPLTMDRRKLASLKVLETIKEGRSVYRVPAERRVAQ